MTRFQDVSIKTQVDFIYEFLRSLESDAWVPVACGYNILWPFSDQFGCILGPSEFWKAMEACWEQLEATKARHKRIMARRERIMALLEAMKAPWKARWEAIGAMVVDLEARCERVVAMEEQHLEAIGAMKVDLEARCERVVAIRAIVDLGARYERVVAIRAMVDLGARCERVVAMEEQLLEAMEQCLGEQHRPSYVRDMEIQLFGEWAPSVKSVRQSPQGSRPGSRAEFLVGFRGVYKRKGIRGYLVQIHPLWSSATWVGAFKTAREAALARDAMEATCSTEECKYNYPELQGTFPCLFSHLQPEAIRNFVQKHAHELARRAENSGNATRSSILSPALKKSEEIQLVDTKLGADPVTTSDSSANKIDAKLQENDYLEKAVKADATGSNSSNPSAVLNDLSEEVEHVDSRLDADPVTTSDIAGNEILSVNPVINVMEERDDAHESTNDTESEDEGSNGGSANESPAEVTGDSLCHETNSKFAGTKRSRDAIDEDEFIARLTPFIKQQIEDALKSTILPLVVVLRSREEGEQKHREQLLALEEQKLALKREKLLFKRRRAVS